MKIIINPIDDLLFYYYQNIIFKISFNCLQVRLYPDLQEDCPVHPDVLAAVPGLLPAPAVWRVSPGLQLHGGRGRLPAQLHPVQGLPPGAHRDRCGPSNISHDWLESKDCQYREGLDKNEEKCT